MSRRITLSSRAARALLPLLAAALPAPVAAQEAEAWVLPRGLLELSATGAYTRWDELLDGTALGAGLAGPYLQLTERLLGAPQYVARTGLADLFASTADPQAGVPGLDSLTGGAATVRLAADVRRVPFTVRYGLTDRLTVFATVPLERSGTVVFGPYLAGATLGLNTAAAANRLVLSRVDPRFGDLGGGLLLPTRDSPAGRELQSRLRARSAADTLVLPTAPVSYEALLENQAVRASLSDEEAAALGLNSARRPYHLGDVQVGARFLLVPGPAGWPFPDTVVRRSVRTAVGVRARLPTGSGDTRFAFEVPPGGGHLGAGVDVLNDVFLTPRWYVNVSASADWLMPRDALRPAFAADRPFPADTAVRTVRVAPGARVALTLMPRWRLTREISFSGEYALLAQARTRLTNAEGGVPSPVEWRTGATAHALGIGMRYSSLQAYARGQARLPFEVSVGVTNAVLGTMQAPDYATVRITGRLFTNPRRLAAALNRAAAAADTLAQPPAGATDTLPSQVRPDADPPAADPAAPASPAPSTPAPTPPAAPARPPLRRE